MAMIKVFNMDDRNFGTNGNIAIKPIKCIETKKKSLNGWYIDVEIPIEYKEYIDKDKLFVVKTKSKINPQAFFIKDDSPIEYTKTKIIFQAEHVIFMARDFFLVDVRPTDLNGASALDYVNERTDKESPFTVNSDVETTNTAYFIRKSLLEAWATIEERWGGSFDVDNFTIQLKQNIGQDRGELIAYGKNLQGIKIYEDWSNVTTKIYPVGKDGLMLPEEYLESEIEYDKPYTRTVTFETELEEELQTEENLINELRMKANAYLEENQFPKVSYEVTSDINQKMEVGDTIYVKHPLVDLQVEVLEYEYNVLTEKVQKIIFGNFSRDVKQRFDEIKEEIKKQSIKISSQESTIEQQTALIKNLNKLGNVFIDDNEILILDELPLENATNILRIGMGGIGFSTTGYDGEYTTAWTIDGKFNADFIKFGTLDGSLIKAGSITAEHIASEVLEQGGSNLLINPVGLFGAYGWEGVCKEYTDTNIKKDTFGKSTLFLQNGTRSQIVQVPNGIYTISFLYKKLLSLADCKIEVNEHVINLTEEEWNKEIYTFEVTSNQIEIKLISDTDDSCYVADLMLNVGSMAQKYSSNATEVVTKNVKIGDGIEVTSTGSSTKQKIDDDGNRIINTKTDEVVAEYTDKGMNTKEIKSTKGEIAEILTVDMGNQTWISRL
jgi:phage minor structural protein